MDSKDVAAPPSGTGDSAEKHVGAWIKQNWWKLIVAISAAGIFIAEIVYRSGFSQGEVQALISQLQAQQVAQQNEVENVTQAVHDLETGLEDLRKSLETWSEFHRCEAADKDFDWFNLRCIETDPSASV